MNFKVLALSNIIFIVFFVNFVLSDNDNVLKLYFTGTELRLKNLLFAILSLQCYSQEKNNKCSKEILAHKE